MENMQEYPLEEKWAKIRQRLDEYGAVTPTGCNRELYLDLAERIVREDNVIPRAQAAVRHKWSDIGDLVGAQPDGEQVSESGQRLEAHDLVVMHLDQSEAGEIVQRTQIRDLI